MKFDASKGIRRHPLDPEPYTPDMINHILILSLRFLTEDQRKILIYNLQDRIGKLPDEE